MDARPQPKASRYSIAAATFGGACNLSCVALSLYEDYCRHYPFVRGTVLPVAVALAPLLVLFALRRMLLVVFVYVSVLVWILVQQVLDLQYGCLSVPIFQKLDVPGVFLVFFGMISAAVFLVWAAIHLIALMRRVLKSERSEP